MLIKWQKNNTIDTKIANNRMSYTQYRNKNFKNLWILLVITCLCMKDSIIPSRANNPGYSTENHFK